MSKITQQDYQEYQSLISDGYSQRAACEALDIPRSTMQDYLKRDTPEEVIQPVMKSLVKEVINIHTSKTSKKEVVTS